MSPNWCKVEIDTWAHWRIFLTSCHLVVKENCFRSKDVSLWPRNIWVNRKFNQPVQPMNYGETRYLTWVEPISWTRTLGKDAGFFAFIRCCLSFYTSCLLSQSFSQWAGELANACSISLRHSILLFISVMNHKDHNASKEEVGWYFLQCATYCYSFCWTILISPTPLIQQKDTKKGEDHSHYPSISIPSLWRGSLVCLCGYTFLLKLPIIGIKNQHQKT